MAQYIRVHESQDSLAVKAVQSYVQGHNDVVKSHDDVVKSRNDMYQGVRETLQDQNSRNILFLRTIGVPESANFAAATARPPPSTEEGPTR